MSFTLKQVLIAVDQLVNALLGGYADETLSSRAYRERRETLVKIIDGIFFWEEKHCFSAYMSERKRLQAPPETRV